MKRQLYQTRIIINCFYQWSAFTERDHPVPTPFIFTVSKGITRRLQMISSIRRLTFKGGSNFRGGVRLEAELIGRVTSKL